MNRTTTWREMISEEMADYGDSFENVVTSTLTDEQLDRKFDSGYGGIEGETFTLWTENRVYFPIVYDGAEWCGSVARHPDGKPTDHQGGC